MNPGDTYWVEFPVRGGRAQDGRRPAVIMQIASATAQLPTVLLLPLTTQMDAMDALRFPGTAFLTVVDKQFIGSYLGMLSALEMQTVQQALESVLAHD